MIIDRGRNGEQLPPDVHIADKFYRRILDHEPEPSWTRIDQFVLLVGGLSFFLYVLDWRLYKRGDEELSAAMFRRYI